MSEAYHGYNAHGFDLVEHLRRQKDFSLRTFGPGARTKGVIDHIRKELAEIEAAPDDITEWVDVIILALDGAWRWGIDAETIASGIKELRSRAGVITHIRFALAAIEGGYASGWIDVANLAMRGAHDLGATREAVFDAIVAKQTKNEGRNWPDWRTADPEKAIEHDRSFDPA